MKKGTKWVKVKTDTLPEELTSFFEQFLDARKAFIEAKKAFQIEASKHVKSLKSVPEGKVPAFNFNGNALMIAYIPDEGTREKGQFSFQNEPGVESEALSQMETSQEIKSAARGLIFSRENTKRFLRAKGF